jgi:elongation factor P
MLSYNELTKGILFVMDGEPWEVLESHFLRMQQRKAVVQTKIKNLISGKIVDRNFQPSEAFEEIEIEKIKVKFLYTHRGEFWFNESGNPQVRFSLKAEVLGGSEKFLKPNMEIIAFKFSDKIINIELPVKADYKVIEAPPAIRGDTAQGGTKVITIETGAKITAPLFINEGDIIKINTETGEYVERIKKA